MARYGLRFWATVLVETATLFVMLKLLLELGYLVTWLVTWLLSCLAKFGPMDILSCLAIFGPMDILYVFWIIAVIITVTFGSIYLAIAYAFDLMNLDFDGNWLGAQQDRIMQSPSEILQETKMMIILDVLIEALLRPYLAGFFENVTLGVGGQSDQLPILD